MRVLAGESHSPLVKAGFCEGEIVVTVRRKLSDIPALRVGLSNNDDGYTFARSQWQR